MNILFFLTPKQDVAFLYDDFTLRQALEKMEYHRYSSIPMLNRKGEYVGTMTEGDLLWAIKNQGIRIENAEEIPIKAIPRKRDYLPVTVNTQMDELVAAAMNQNFVPVLDDKIADIVQINVPAPPAPPAPVHEPVAAVQVNERGGAWDRLA